MAGFQLIDGVVIIALLWLAVGLLGVAFPRNFEMISRWLFPIGAVIGIVLAVIALFGIASVPQTRVLPLGLPDLPFHLRLDALSSFFLFLLGATSAGISVYASGYIRRNEGTTASLQCLLYHIFLASMVFVMLADDGYAFMVAWETMALSSFFLVTAEHSHAEIRRAGYLYLLVAHIGAVGILLSFGVMAGSLGDYSFDAMRSFATTGVWPSVAFLLALFGFGAKAGLLPMHIWLPEAHPAAPSPVSALMSGVMLKTAVYGMLRITFDLLHVQHWWWGVILLVLGLLAALFGVIFSAIQSDMKRLLAYSSIDNIGLIFVGIGLTLIFKAFNQPLFSALAITATLYHCINHAFFKSLLFLSTGSVLHATGERNLGKLGGLIHRMPWVAWLALVGALASAGLPPLNGFISEWLLLQSFLFTSGLPHGYLNMLLPVSAAAIALVAALAAFAMVKFFGVIFLGQPREENLALAHDANNRERIGLLWLAVGCILLGLFPSIVISMIDPISRQLVDGSLNYVNSHMSWWLIAPINTDRASYSPAIFFGTLAIFTPLVYWAVKKFFNTRQIFGAPWDCGFPQQTARMQDTAQGFGQPIRRIFSPFLKSTGKNPSPFDTQPKYYKLVEDPFWYWIYLPIVRFVELGTRLISFLQQGRIAIYLLYSFLTLLILLVLTRG